MKLIIFLFAFLFFSLSLFSQNKFPGLTEYVKTFRDAKIGSEGKIQEVINEDQDNINRFGPTYLRSIALRKYIQSLSFDDFLDIIEKRNKSYEEDLYKPQEFWMKHDDEIVNSRAIDSVRFGIYEGMLRENLQSLYGDAITQLIFAPVFIKVKIIKEHTERIMIREDSWIGKVVITAEIEDIVKGHSHFKVGDNIQFYYIPFWLQKGNRFNIDDSFLIPLIPVISNKDGRKSLALDVNNVNNGIVKIYRDIVQDEENYFGLGKITWSDFKYKITSKINVKNLKGEIK